MINSIVGHIYEAKREAMVRGIEVDAVAINDLFMSLNEGG